MGKWDADFANDPFDDYSLIVELLHEGEEVGVIKRRKNGMEIKWYSHEEEIIVPFDWILDLLVETKKRFELSDLK